MDRQEIVALFARRQADWDHLNAASLAADHSEDGRVESPLAGGIAAGRAAIEKLYNTYFTAFADLHLEQDELLIDGNRAVLVGRASGTDTGGFMGMEPTGRAFSVPVVFCYELQGGLIHRERRVYDFTGVLVQVGLLKTKPV
jgi:predicted ester cyclase